MNLLSPEPDPGLDPGPGPQGYSGSGAGAGIDFGDRVSVLAVGSANVIGQLRSAAAFGKLSR